MREKVITSVILFFIWSGFFTGTPRVNSQNFEELNVIETTILEIENQINYTIDSVVTQRKLDGEKINNLIKENQRLLKEMDNLKNKDTIR